MNLLGIKLLTHSSTLNNISWTTMPNKEEKTAGTVNPKHVSNIKPIYELCTFIVETVMEKPRLVVITTILVLLPNKVVQVQGILNSGRRYLSISYIQTFAPNHSVLLRVEAS